MTKEELLINIRGHQAAIAKIGWIRSGLAIAILTLIAFMEWLDRFHYVNLPEYLSVSVLSLLVVFWGFHSTANVKKNDEKHKLFCPLCNKKYDQPSFVIAILENRCQACGSEIYEKT